MVDIGLIDGVSIVNPSPSTPSLHAVRPPGNLPGPNPRHPAVSGPHGDMASVCHNNLQASSERSSGANDRLEKVTRIQISS